MILSDYNHVKIIGREQGNVPGGSRKNGGVRRENEFLFRIPETPLEETGKGAGNVSAEEEFYKNQAAGQLIRSTSQDGKQLNREELQKLLAEHREEILKKLKNGDTGAKIPIGSMELTQEEWEKLLDSYDEAQESFDGGNLPTDEEDKEQT